MKDICQRCKINLDLDDSLLSVGNNSINILKSSINSDALLSNINLPNVSNNNKSSPGTPSTRTIINKSNNSNSKNYNSISESYIHVPNNNNNDDNDEDISPTSIRMKLFAILSTKSDIEHPLCTDCANLALDFLAKEFEDLKNERDAYISFDTFTNDLKEVEGNYPDQQNLLKKVRLCYF